QTSSPTITPQAVADSLFGGSIMSYQIEGVFDEQFRGQRVQWSGTLLSASRYPFDRVFGQSPGTKAVVQVHQAASGGRRRSMRATVQLPLDTLIELRPKIGKPVAFEGELLECDGFMSTVYVGNGRVLWSGGDTSDPTPP
ncbi:MAG: hypothetical protein PVH40_07680, partial [Gemmatimonadales bacterium]